MNLNESFIMLNKIIIATLGVVPVVKGYGQVVQKNPDKPNVIVFLVDDLGWKDVGFMGSKYYETPNIDRFARQFFTKRAIFRSALVIKLKQIVRDW